MAAPMSSHQSASKFVGPFFETAFCAARASGVAPLVGALGLNAPP
jgi:hypothetical protein